MIKMTGIDEKLPKIIKRYLECSKIIKSDPLNPYMFITTHSHYSLYGKLYTNKFCWSKSAVWKFDFSFHINRINKTLLLHRFLPFFLRKRTIILDCFLSSLFLGNCHGVWQSQSLWDDSAEWHKDQRWPLRFPHCTT